MLKFLESLIVSPIPVPEVGGCGSKFQAAPSGVTILEIPRILGALCQEQVQRPTYTVPVLHLAPFPAFETPYQPWTKVPVVDPYSRAPQPPQNPELFPQPGPWVVKPGAWCPGFKDQMCCLLAVGPWASDLPSLACFLICEPAHLPHRVAVGTKGQVGLRAATGTGGPWALPPLGQEAFPDHPVPHPQALVALFLTGTKCLPRSRVTGIPCAQQWPSFTLNA